MHLQQSKVNLIQEIWNLVEIVPLWGRNPDVSKARFGDIDSN